MTLSEKYWLTVLLTFLRYISILMIGSGGAFLFVGYYVNKWFYLLLITWPFLIMWGVVNLRYLRAVHKKYELETK